MTRLLRTLALTYLPLLAACGGAVMPDEATVGDGAVASEDGAAASEDGAIAAEDGAPIGPDGAVVSDDEYPAPDAGRAGIK